MIHINEQIASEYAFIVMSKGSLYIRWTIYNADIAREGIHADQAQPPVLPERVLTQLIVLSLRISSDTSTPHCSNWLLSSFLFSGDTDIHAVDLQAAIRVLTGRAPKLRLFLFYAKSDIDRDVNWMDGLE